MAANIKNVMKRLFVLTGLSLFWGNLDAQNYLQFDDSRNARQKSRIELFCVTSETSDSKGKYQKPKVVKKETKVKNGIKIVEFENLDCIFEYIKLDDYSGIQGFPSLSNAFYWRNKIELSGTLSLPDVVKIYGKDSDQGYFSETNIEKLILSPCLTYIGRRAFWKCKELKEVVFPEGCGDVQIGESVFEGCKNIKIIRVPKGKVEYFAKMLKLPESIFEDGGATLEYNITVERPSTILEKLPADKLAQIGKLAVTGILDENDLAIIKSCKNLKELDLSHAYTTLSASEQEKRNSKKEFILGMLQTMGKVATEQYKNGEIGVIDNLQVQLVAEMAKDASQVKSGSSGCIIPRGAFGDMHKLETVKLPYRATLIEGKAFFNCQNLRHIELPLFIEKIGISAFENCENIDFPQFPATLKIVGDNAFNGCKSVTKLDFSRCIFNVKNGVGYFAFSHPNNLKELHLPEGVSVIHSLPNRSNDTQCIEFYMPNSLEKIITTSINKGIVHFKNCEPPILDSSIIENSTIYVPKGCMTKYYAKFNGRGNSLKEE